MDDKNAAASDRIITAYLPFKKSTTRAARFTPIAIQKITWSV
jgi:hypothetical protein